MNTLVGISFEENQLWIVRINSRWLRLHFEMGCFLMTFASVTFWKILEILGNLSRTECDIIYRVISVNLEALNSWMTGKACNDFYWPVNKSPFFLEFIFHSTTFATSMILPWVVSFLLFICLLNFKDNWMSFSNDSTDASVYLVMNKLWI